MPRRPGEMRRGRPSMADVAELAGVSGQTVSRVANGNPRVSPETRARVEQAMDEIGYRAHAAARALATGRFGTLGVVSFDLTEVGNLYIVDAAIRQAQERGYTVNLATVPTATDAGLQAAVRRLTDRAVDGMIVVEARILDTPSLTLPQDLPVVVAEGATDRYPSVGVDHTAGARVAVEHLIGLGHRTVHHVSGLASSYPAASRQRSWQEVLRAAGAPVPRPLAGDWSVASGYAAGLQLLRDDSVTAVFAANDRMAIGVLRAAAEHGRSVPGDLSLVGYDDSEAAAHLVPSLTTVRHDLTRVGRLSVELLLAGLGADSRLPVTADLLAPELVVRQSTAPPR